jgi:hypothetical protein
LSLSEGAVRSLESFALFEVICRNPLMLIRVPEQVVAGGVDDLDAVDGLDVEVVEVGVVVDFDGATISGLVLPVAVLVASTLSPGLREEMGWSCRLRAGPGCPR